MEGDNGTPAAFSRYRKEGDNGTPEAFPDTGRKGIMVRQRFSRYRIEGDNGTPQANENRCPTQTRLDMIS